MWANGTKRTAAEQVWSVELQPSLHHCITRCLPNCEYLSLCGHLCNLRRILTLSRFRHVRKTESRILFIAFWKLSWKRCLEDILLALLACWCCSLSCRDVCVVPTIAAVPSLWTDVVTLSAIFPVQTWWPAVPTDGISPRATKYPTSLFLPSEVSIPSLIC